MSAVPCGHAKIGKRLYAKARQLKKEDLRGLLQDFEGEKFPLGISISLRNHVNKEGIQKPSKSRTASNLVDR